MEITKGENANLAGMEFTEDYLAVLEREQVDGSLMFQLVRQLRERTAERNSFDSQRQYLLKKLAGSPAPTPPLDVLVDNLWTHAVRSMLEDGHRYPSEVEAKAVLKSALRRHIASPAQPEKRDAKACEVCGETEMLTVMGRNQYACPKHRAVAPQSGKEGQS